MFVLALGDEEVPAWFARVHHQRGVVGVQALDPHAVAEIESAAVAHGRVEVVVLAGGLVGSTVGGDQDVKHLGNRAWVGAKPTTGRSRLSAG